jgi:predicted GIY-YIG superfamily endonuclease
MYVYIISNESFDGWLKVGKTNDIKRRVSELQTAAPTEHIVELLVDGMEYDHEAHMILVEQGIEKSGEWFKCDLATAREAVLKARQNIKMQEDMVAVNRLKAANEGWIVSTRSRECIGEKSD